MIGCTLEESYEGFMLALAEGIQRSHCRGVGRAHRRLGG